MTDRARRIAENLARVNQQIADAARVSGRDADAVKLVAVTKYVDAAEALALVAAGCRDLGESRPQQLWQKAEEMTDESVRWHLVGHLQRNKIARALPCMNLLHSLDSVRLARAIDKAASERPTPLPVLIEVNVSGDDAKHGFDPNELEAVLPQLANFKHLEIGGLMAMAGREGGPERARCDFQQLRELRDRLSRNCPENVRLDALSMGMSGDFREAIEEGATIVRVGSALWEGLAL